MDIQTPQPHATDARDQKNPRLGALIGILACGVLLYFTLIMPCLAAKHGKPSVYLLRIPSILGSAGLFLSTFIMVGGRTAYTWLECSAKERTVSFYLFCGILGIASFVIYVWAREWGCPGKTDTRWA